MFKNIVHTSLISKVIVFVAFLYIRFVQLNSQIKIEGQQYPWHYWEQDKPVIIAIWHGRLLMFYLLVKHLVKKKKITVLISSSKDGRMIAAFAKMFGLNVVYGSTSKGGATAVREMMRYIKKGHSIIITPDGPRGPRMNISRGVMELARLSEAPICPATIACSKRKIMGSWDRLLLPYPFGKVIIRWAEPIHVRSGLDESLKARARTDAEIIMVGLQLKADHDVGCATTILPAKPESDKT